MGWLKWWRGVIAAGAAFLVGLGSAVGGELVVISSNNAGDYPPGRVIDRAEAVTLASGATLTLLSQGGQSVAVKGPHSGTVPALADEAADPSVIASLAALVGDMAEEKRALGAIRAAPSRAPADPFVLDVTKSNVHCLPAGQTAGPALWRPATIGVDETLTVRSGTETMATLLWRKGEPTMAWPAGVSIVEGATYTLKLDGAKRSTRAKFLFMPQGADDVAAQIVWMAENGCRSQARHILGALAG